MKTRKRTVRTSESDRDRIVELYKSGMSQAAVGRIFNITQGAVYVILKLRGVPARTLSEASARKALKKDEHYFDSIDSPEKAYWLGFITADGNISGSELQIKLGRRDAAHLAAFIEDISSTIQVDFGINNLGVDTARVRVHSVSMTEALRAHGVTENKTWTAKPWQGDRELILHYWRGVVDGDGWVSTVANGTTKRFYTVGVSGNPAIVKGFADYIQSELGYKNKPVKRILKSGNLFCQVSYTGTHRAKNVCALLGYEGAENRALPRKREAAATILEYTPDQKCPKTISMGEARQVLTDRRSGMTTDEVAEKHDIGKGTVYNIEKGTGRFAVLHSEPSTTNPVMRG